MRSSFVTVTDQFCGAGGSSIGATTAGAELKLALNHWRLAIDTHNTNFPNALHDCTDISACDPRRYPSTDILITSPECTNHSLAKGQSRQRHAQSDLFGAVKVDPAAERSRANPAFCAIQNAARPMLRPTGNGNGPRPKSEPLLTANATQIVFRHRTAARASSTAWRPTSEQTAGSGRIPNQPLPLCSREEP